MPSALVRTGVIAIAAAVAIAVATTMGPPELESKRLVLTVHWPGSQHQAILKHGITVSYIIYGVRTEYPSEQVLANAHAIVHGSNSIHSWVEVLYVEEGVPVQLDAVVANGAVKLTCVISHGGTSSTPHTDYGEVHCKFPDSTVPAR